MKHNYSLFTFNITIYQQHDITKSHFTSDFTSGIRGKTGSIRLPKAESCVMKYPTEFACAC